MTTSEPTSAVVADRIRDAILKGEFVPNQRLIETDLCEAYSASRANVRSALAELTNERLVERIQNRGARVRAVSLDEAIEISEVRMVLEGLCAHKAAIEATPEEVEELRTIGEVMKESVAAGDFLTYSRKNHELHARIGAISRQETANQIIQRVRAQIVRHQYRLATQPGRPKVSLPEHLEIIDAICEGQPERAEQALRSHLYSVIDALRTSSEVHERKQAAT